MRICPVSTQEQIEAVRVLFQEYASWLGVDLCFQRFSEELAALPGAYAPPGGRLFLATDGNQAAGCAALRPISRTMCEMKRLYVRPAFQRRGQGKKLSKAIIDSAGEIGYSTIVLDTLRRMTPAIQLYKTLGFVERSPYYETPLQDTVFMELRLSANIA
jgi:ribosomal protein S18 acetylase RimI-like enzyme